MADYIEKKLKKQGILLGRSDGTQYIVLESEYRIDIEDEIND